ncbi:NADH-quinone oxidoreductase subunit L [Buchnera aphidicola]|uniref:NADH-quinone oxidoreductase subunit L n=1 Tax=Buchnera aphidicola TaxID=9 RepID=UPI003463872B
MNLIYLVVLFPLISFVIISFLKQFLSYFYVTVISIGSIILSLITLIISGKYFLFISDGVLSKKLWVWWTIANFKINICLLLDSLSLSFLSIIIGIGLLIHIFSIWYMNHQCNKKIFFALINLFIANMSLLVLSDNFILMYFGWEGVSICSYLLINFYYFKKDVGFSAIKSFLMTRIGDLFLMIAIFILYFYFSTVSFYNIQFLIKIHLINYKIFLNCITLLLLFGAIGKSAQIPLQTWLPEAMVGPTPVSALIHAATMVTAGVYLISRNHDLFILTPNILYLVGIIGILTFFCSSFSALVQTDIKRILAYSTMGQIGFMFVSLSIGAWGAAIIHLMTHAIFKALLFLSAGSLILKCNHEKNIFKMGNNLWKKLPFLYICFLLGGSSLSAFPFLTAGFYSKGDILFSLFMSHSKIFFIFSVFSSFLTVFYIFRLIFIVFHNRSNIIHMHTSNSWIKKLSISWIHNIPLVILMLFSTVLMTYIFPILSGVFPENHINYNKQFYFEYFSGVCVIFSICMTYYFCCFNMFFIQKISNFKYFYWFIRFFYNGWGFYKLYNTIFLTSYLKFNSYFSIDPINSFISIILICIKRINLYLLLLENRFLNVYISLIIFSYILIMILISLNISI